MHWGLVTSQMTSKMYTNIFELMMSFGLINIWFSWRLLKILARVINTIFYSWHPFYILFIMSDVNNNKREWESDGDRLFKVGIKHLDVQGEKRSSYRHAKETKHFHRHPVQQYHKSCTSQTSHKICVKETWVLCKVRQLYYLLNFSNFPKRTISIENCASKKWSK